MYRRVSTIPNPSSGSARWWTVACLGRDIAPAERRPVPTIALRGSDHRPVRAVRVSSGVRQAGTLDGSSGVSGVRCDDGPTPQEWRRRLDEMQAEALADLGRQANPLSVPPPAPGPPESPASEQSEEPQAALARDFPAWTIWRTTTRWYAAGPCPCSPNCQGQRTLHGETSVSCVPSSRRLPNGERSDTGQRAQRKCRHGPEALRSAPRPASFIH